jgi:flagellar protein FlbD
MIGLTRLNGHLLVVNAELIETIEATPDTVVALTSGKKFVVLESPDEVIERVVHYRQKVSLTTPCATVSDDLPPAQTVSPHEN